VRTPQQARCGSAREAAVLTARAGSPRHCLRKHGARGDVNGHELGHQRAGVAVGRARLSLATPGTARHSAARGEGRQTTQERADESTRQRLRQAVRAGRSPPVPSSKSAASTTARTMALACRTGGRTLRTTIKDGKLELFATNRASSLRYKIYYRDSCARSPKSSIVRQESCS
jgi:hypothetical protein